MCERVRAPAAQRGLEKGGDPHAEENSPYQLTGGPLIETDAHGLGQEEGHGDGSAEAGQVVLPGDTHWSTRTGRHTLTLTLTLLLLPLVQIA